MEDFRKWKEDLDGFNKFLAELEIKGAEIPNCVFGIRNRIENSLIRNWDCDSNHIFQCEGCPHRPKGQYEGLPCGQQHCWVDVTCNPDKYR